MDGATSEIAQSNQDWQAVAFYQNHIKSVSFGRDIIILSICQTKSCFSTNNFNSSFFRLSKLSILMGLVECGLQDTEW